MNIFYVPELQEGSDILTLSEEESKHACRVLRLKSGDKIQLLNGQGGIAIAEICEDNPKKCVLKIVEFNQEPPSDKEIHIAVAPTKNMDRIEWFVEKACEIGITELTFILGKNSERKQLKLERIHKILISAMKQSKRSYLPIVHDLTSIKDFFGKYQNGAIAHCYEEQKRELSTVFKTANYPILIGPEGDFTRDEIQMALDNNFDFITLGETRLRTETAALVAVVYASIL